MGDFLFEWQATDQVRLSQWMLGFNSHGIGFAYQRDRFPDNPLTTEDDPRSINTFRLAASLPFPRGTLGFGFTMHRGGDEGNEVGWDFGLRYRIAPTFTVAGVLRHIGRPVPLDTPLPLGGVVGFSWLAIPRVFEASGEVQLAEEVGGSGVDALYRAGLGFSPGVDFPGSLRVALDVGSSFSVQQWIVAVSIGRSARGIVAGSGPVANGSTDVERLSVGGVVKRAAMEPRP